MGPTTSAGMLAVMQVMAVLVQVSVWVVVVWT
jgi:hypothetical protein